jgi:hypothetical protein
VRPLLNPLRVTGVAVLLFGLLFCVACTSDPVRDQTTGASQTSIGKPRACLGEGQCLQTDNGVWVKVLRAAKSEGTVLIDYGGPAVPVPGDGALAARLPPWTSNYDRVLILEPWTTVQPPESCLRQLAMAFETMVARNLPADCRTAWQAMKPADVAGTVKFLEKTMGRPLIGVYAFSFGATRTQPAWSSLQQNRGWLIIEAPSPVQGYHLNRLLRARTDRALASLSASYATHCAKQPECEPFDTALGQLPRLAARQDSMVPDAETPRLTVADIYAALLSISVDPINLAPDFWALTAGDGPLAPEEILQLRRLSLGFTLRNGSGTALRSALGFQAEVCAVYRTTPEITDDPFLQVLHRVHGSCPEAAQPFSTAPLPENTCMVVNTLDSVQDISIGAGHDLPSSQRITVSSLGHRPDASSLSSISWDTESRTLHCG